MIYDLVRLKLFMRYLSTIDPPILLDSLAGKIRKSSNFRFEWQFYEFNGIDPHAPQGIRIALDLITSTPQLHQFLRNSCEDEFTIATVHEHSRIVPAASSFPNTLSKAANDHLGAYSHNLRAASLREQQKIESLFSSIGDFLAYELLPGENKDCQLCRNHNNHLFSSWFYEVAWDWCFFVAWPSRKILWIGCLTDTD
jgi:hypothetical protein